MAEFLSIRLFNDLYMNYYNCFVKFANSYVKDTALAEDITTEAFLAYWENKDNLAANSNIPAYIFVIVKNKCLNHLQHLNVKNRTLNNIQDYTQWELSLSISTLSSCNPEELFSTEMQEIIDKTLSSLPKKTYEVFSLSRYKNQSHKEIAQALNISVKGVEFHITKALSQLRENLKDYMLCIVLFFINIGNSMFLYSINASCC